MPVTLTKPSLADRSMVNLAGASAHPDLGESSSVQSTRCRWKFQPHRNALFSRGYPWGVGPLGPSTQLPSPASATTLTTLRILRSSVVSGTVRSTHSHAATVAHTDAHLHRPMAQSLWILDRQAFCSACQSLFLDFVRHFRSVKAWHVLALLARPSAGRDDQGATWLAIGRRRPKCLTEWLNWNDDASLIADLLAARTTVRW